MRRLSTQILSGQLGPGTKLPTEQQLVEALGVSRTVVREAVAALRADGLVHTRQGVGAFVAEHGERRPFRIDPDDLASLPKLLNVMELRTGVEIEAAGLAALRRSTSHLHRMAMALDAVDLAIAQGDLAVKADFEFHCAVADASGNPLFREFLQYLGAFIIPRQTVRASTSTAQAQSDYLARVQSEHRSIQSAIDARDETQAREAMLAHLRRSRERYGALSGALGTRASRRA